MNLWPFELQHGRSNEPPPYDNYLFAMAWLDEKWERIDFANKSKTVLKIG
jgi:hypothetical protein